MRHCPYRSVRIPRLARSVQPRTHYNANAAQIKLCVTAKCIKTRESAWNLQGMAMWLGDKCNQACIVLMHTHCRSVRNPPVVWREWCSSLGCHGDADHLRGLSHQSHSDHITTRIRLGEYRTHIVLPRSCNGHWAHRDQCANHSVHFDENVGTSLSLSLGSLALSVCAIHIKFFNFAAEECKRSRGRYPCPGIADNRAASNIGSDGSTHARAPGARYS